MTRTILSLLLAASATAATAQAPASGAERGPWPLTPEGYGPARIGMTRAQVERALGVTLQGEPIDSEYVCVEMVPVRADADADANIVFMFLERRLSRIAVVNSSPVRTPRGIGIGASAAQVRRAYPTGLLAEEHSYTGAPAEYLTFWVRRERSGVRFTTDENRRVDTIIAGNESIRYIEGCA